MLLEALVGLLVAGAGLLLLLVGARVLVGELFQVLVGDVGVARELVLGLLEEVGHGVVEKVGATRGGRSRR